MVFIVNRYNSQLLRTICASTLNILYHNLLRPELIRASQGNELAS